MAACWAVAGAVKTSPPTPSPVRAIAAKSRCPPPAGLRSVRPRQRPRAVVVIGAGPYGLAAAAHLREAGVAAQVYGDAMASWRHNMPKGMRLRHATDIADPHNRFLLQEYVRTKGLQATEQLPLDHFIAYGEGFQQRMVPDLNRRKVVKLALAPGGFRLTLDDGDVIEAAR